MTGGWPGLAKLAAPLLAASAAVCAWACFALYQGEPPWWTLLAGPVLAATEVLLFRAAYAHLVSPAGEPRAGVAALAIMGPPGLAVACLWIGGVLWAGTPLHRLAVALGQLGVLAIFLTSLRPALRPALHLATEPGAVPGWPGRGAWVVLGSSLAFQLATVVAVPVLIQVDSVTNTYEPPLFEFGTKGLHHTPLYFLLVKACVAGDLRTTLSLVAVSQSLLVVGMAVAVERALLRLTNPWVAVVGGLLVGLDPLLTNYAREIMTEVPAGAMLLAAALLLEEARVRPRTHPWLLAGGLCAAVATLTKQAIEYWVVCALGWMMVWGPWRPRARACGLFLVGALLPLYLLTLHNYTFLGRQSLTVSLGRALLYRVCFPTDLPPLHDPEASPGDPFERARRIVWEEREKAWVGPYGALQHELGWSDEQVDQALVRLFMERVRGDPLRFAWNTLVYGWEGATYRAEPLAGLIAFHDQICAGQRGTSSWGDLPAGGAVPVWIEFSEAIDVPARAPVLLLVLAAPLLAAPAARPLGWLCLISVAYLVLTPAVAQIPLARFRLPAVPFVIMGAALSADGVWRRWRAWQRPNSEPLA